MSCRHLGLVALVSTSILVMVLGLFPLAQSQSRVGGLLLKPGERNLASAVIDTANHYAYFGTDTSPGAVVAVNLANFTRAGAFTFRTGENRVLSAVIDTANGYGYFGTYTSPGVIVKIRLSDFTRVAALTLGSGEDRLRSAVIDVTHGFAYFGADTQPGLIVRIRLADFARVDSLTLNPGEGGLVSALIDPIKGFAYFGTSTSPGRIVKISLPNFARLDALVLNQGENVVLSAVMDEKAGFAYFGTETDPGIVLKVRLSDFTRVDALGLFVGEGGLSSGVIDPEHDAAYFGTDAASSGTSVVKIRLSNLSRVVAISLAGAEVVLRSAVIDSSGGFAYFGTYTDPGIVVKFSLFAAAATAATTSTFRFSDTQSPSPGLFQFVPIPFLGLAGVLVAVAVTSAVILVKRKATFRPATTMKTVQEEIPPTAPKPPPALHIVEPAQPWISTGYPDLDRSLAGGLPEGYAVAIVSPSYDERDLLIRKMIESALSSGRLVFYLSSDIAKTRDLTSRYDQNFYALSPASDKIASARSNLFKIPDVGDLSNLNITSNEIIQSKVTNAQSKVIIIDFLTDVLLRNKALTTRRWISDFSAKRKAEGFTILATLDPSIAKDDTQILTGVFDGIIEIYEKDLLERSRRFLIIKKMYGRRYSEMELMLDKDRLL